MATIKVRREFKGTHSQIQSAVEESVNLLERSLSAKVVSHSPGLYVVTGTCFGDKPDVGHRPYVALLKVNVTFEMEGN